MTQRIHDRLHSELNLDNEILVGALRTGKYIDQFTTHCATPEETNAILNRLPKCMNFKKPIDKIVTTKKCSKCKQDKSIYEFHKNRTTKDGIQAYCKSCQIIDVNKYQKTEKGKTKIKLYAQSKEGKARYKRYRQSENGDAVRKRYAQSEIGKAVQKRGGKRFNVRHPNHRKAKNAVNHAVKAGKLSRPDTLQCHYGKHLAQQYHHYLGYEPEHWLDVIPVCKQCHYENP